jgi:uncharacterized protein
MPAAITLDMEALAALARRYHVARFALFGSVLRSDFTETSDVDVLVEFLPDKTPGLKFFQLQAELSTLVGRSVDLHTPAFISARFRKDVLAEAEVIHVAA